MSGQKPSFLTGANAKIKIGAITIAYAQDTSYRVSVATIPIEVMGRYEVISHEPIAYAVEGSLSVIRYTKDATGVGAAGTTTSGITAATGNGIGHWAITDSQKGSASFNPRELLVSQTFDLEIFQKNGLDGDNEVLSSAVKLIDCRFTSKGGSINKRGVLTEQYSFNAILAQDDSFVVARSGGSGTDLSA